MDKKLKEYKEYYIHNSGYDSNHIENPALTKEEFTRYYRSAKLRGEDIKKVLSIATENKQKYNSLIAHKETENFKTAVDYLFDLNIDSENSIERVQKYNATLMKDFDNGEWGDRFSALATYGAGKLRTGKLFKENNHGIDIEYMRPDVINYDLDLINSRINKALKSDELSIKDKVNEVILYHLNFELIHPFGEGNGRTGRLLMDEQLFELGLPSISFKAEENLPDLNYNDYIGDIMEQREYENRQLKFPELFHSVPAKFQYFVWKQYGHEIKKVKEANLDELFLNINELDWSKNADYIKKNFKEIDKEAKAQQKNLSDEDLEDLNKTYEKENEMEMEE